MVAILLSFQVSVYLTRSYKKTVFLNLSVPAYFSFFKIFSEVRGTTNAWDALTDAQLWSAAALMQVVRFILPAGDIWTPLLDRLIQLISSLDTSAVERVAFYKDTTQFVDLLLENGIATNRTISVTGM